MATDVNTPSHARESPPKSGAESPTTVVADIIHDATELFNQQLKMFQAEVREDIAKFREAAIPAACGLVTLMIGAIVLGAALALLLNWIWPELQLWGAFALVGVLLTATGAGLFYAGKKRLEALHPLPEKSAQALKENLQWLTPK